MDHRTELVDVIRRVRNRWRLRLALRGAVIVVAGTLLALLLSASSLEALRFSPAAIISFRMIALLVFGGLVYYGLVRALMRRVNDNQVALYLVENAIERCRTLEDGLAIERQGLRRHVYLLAGVAAFGVLLIVFGPDFFRH